MANFYWPVTQSSVTVGAIPIQFELDGAETTVSEDTAVPANSNPLPVKILDDSGVPVSPLTDAELRATPVDVDTGLTQPLTDTQLRATPVSVTGPLTDSQLRASPVSVTGPLTNTELRASPVPVSGPLTDTQLRASPVAISGSVAVSGTVTANSTLVIVDQLDTPLLVASSSNIPASASNPLQVVATLAATVKRIRVNDTTGGYIGLYTGASLSEVLACIIGPGIDGYIDVAIASGTRISLRNMQNAVISVGELSVQFYG